METELTSILDKVVPLKTAHRTGPRKAKNWLSPEAVDAKKQRRRLERQWKASNAEPDRLAYRAACSSANKLITSLFAASNLERINEASENPKRLWTTIKSILHSSPPNEQLSPPISQSLANSLASFFYQKIFSLKDSIASKLHGSSTPFDFDPPHSGEVLSDFTPVTPAEVSQLLRSMSNKSSPVDYIPTSLWSVWSDLFDLIWSRHSPDPFLFPPAPPPKLINFIPATLTEIYKLISASENKLCPLDSIPTFLLKLCFNELGPIITNLVNLSFWRNFSIVIQTSTCPASSQKTLSIHWWSQQLSSNFKPQLHFQNSRKSCCLPHSISPVF